MLLNNHTDMNAAINSNYPFVLILPFFYRLFSVFVHHSYVGQLFDSFMEA